MSVVTLSTRRFQIAPAQFALLGAATLASVGFAAAHAPGPISMGAAAPVLAVAVAVAAFASTWPGPPSRPLLERFCFI